MMKRTVEGLARMLGLEIQPAWRLPRLPHARKLQRIFEDFEIETVLDVGANVGQFRDFLRHQVGFQGHIHSFEPIAALVDEMRRRSAEDRRWIVHQVALGAERGAGDINVMASTVFSSFLEPADLPEFRSVNRVERKERVAIETLDDLMLTTLSDVDLRRTFLKLDTQGYDLEAVKGAKEAIAQIPALQTEVSVKMIYDSMPGMAQSVSMLAALGFELSDLFLVTEEQLCATEFDCVMVRLRSARERGCSTFASGPISRPPREFEWTAPSTSQREAAASPACPDGRRAANQAHDRRNTEPTALKSP